MRQRINENMVWTDSQDYGADEILYTIGTVLFNINNRLMREITILFEVYPPAVPILFEVYPPVVPRSFQSFYVNYNSFRSLSPVVLLQVSLLINHH